MSSVLKENSITDSLNFISGRFPEIDESKAPYLVDKIINIPSNTILYKLNRYNCKSVLEYHKSLYTSKANSPFIGDNLEQIWFSVTPGRPLEYLYKSCINDECINIYERNKDTIETDFIYMFVNNYDIDLIDISKHFTSLLSLLNTIYITKVEFIYFSYQYRQIYVPYILKNSLPLHFKAIWENPDDTEILKPAERKPKDIAFMIGLGYRDETGYYPKETNYSTSSEYVKWK